MVLSLHTVVKEIQMDGKVMQMDGQLSEVFTIILVLTLVHVFSPLREST
jgi:hypothetical protein